MQAGIYSTAMYWDGLTFLTPKPRPYRSFDSAMSPFQGAVWASIAGMLFTMAVFMFSVSNTEQSIVPYLTLKHWAMLGQALWYCMGTLIGENVTRDSKSDGAWALR